MFPKATIELHPAGHPVLSHPYLDKFALVFLRRYFEKHVQRPTVLSANDLIEVAKREEGLKFEFTDLGSLDGRKRLGSTYLKGRLILLDNCLLDTRRVSLPFVTAHEIAHWILHRGCAIKDLRNKDAMPDDDVSMDNPPVPVFERTPLQWIEWQASALAAAILIPEEAAKLAVRAAHRSQFQTRRQNGLIYNNGSPSAVLEADVKLGLVAEMFGVSKTVTRIRLKHLELYEEQDRTSGAYSENEQKTLPIRTHLPKLR